MPYKIHTLPSGKFKLYREKVGDKPARPLSKHPQSKATATAQLRAIKMHENESASETPEMMKRLKFEKMSNGKIHVKRSEGNSPEVLPELMHGPKNEPRSNDGKWTAKSNKYTKIN
jgi:hypothetical protein